MFFNTQSNRFPTCIPHCTPFLTHSPIRECHHPTCIPHYAMFIAHNPNTGLALTNMYTLLHTISTHRTNKGVLHVPTHMHTSVSTFLEYSQKMECHLHFPCIPHCTLFLTHSPNKGVPPPYMHTSFRTVFTTQSSVPLNAGFSPGFGNGAV